MCLLSLLHSELLLPLLILFQTTRTKGEMEGKERKKDCKARANGVARERERETWKMFPAIMVMMLMRRKMSVWH